MVSRNSRRLPLVSYRTLSESNLLPLFLGPQKKKKNYTTFILVQIERLYVCYKIFLVDENKKKLLKTSIV